MGISWKPQFHELEDESNMLLLKPHSRTSELRGNEADEVRRKKRKNGRPTFKGQEEIVNENHRHATRNGGGARSFTAKRKMKTKNEKKNST